MRCFQIDRDAPNRSDGLRRYMTDIERIPLLSADDEAELGFRSMNGDEDARERLVKANLRFVVSVAKSYYARNRRVPLADLVSAGNMGLISAAAKWKADLGFRFMTFAVWYIRSAIDQSITYDRTIRCGMAFEQMVRKVDRFCGDYAVRGFGHPGVDDICDGTGLDEWEVRRVRKEAPYVLSLDRDELSAQDGDYLLCEQPEDITPGCCADTVLSILKPRDASILRGAVGLDGMPVPPDDIADELNLSRARVQQIIAKSKRRLHSPRVREILIR